MLLHVYWLLSAVAISPTQVKAQEKGNETSYCPKECTCTPVTGNHTSWSATCYLNFPVDVPTSITGLTVNYVQIPTLDSARLKELTQLKHLDLRHCGITEIQDGAFTPLRELQVLELSHNSITVIEKNALASNKQLRELYLNANKLKFISSDAFVSLKNLVVVHLENNDLSQIPYSLPQSVETLYIQNNNINIMPPNMILPNIKTLNLCGNKIQNFSFLQMKVPSVKSLCLGNRSLNIPVQTMQQMHSIEELILDGQDTQEATLSEDIQLGLSEMTTLQKLEIAGYSFPNIDFIKNLTKLVTLRLTSVQSDVTFHTLALKNLHNLTIFDVSRSPFLAKHILEHPQVVVSLKNLQYFGLAGDNIQTLSEQDFNSVFLGQLHLDISYNPLHCNCSLTWVVDKVDPYTRGDIRKGEMPQKEIILEKQEDTLCFSPQHLQGQQIMKAQFCTLELDASFTTFSTDPDTNITRDMLVVQPNTGLSTLQILYIVLGIISALVILSAIILCICCLKGKKKGFHEIATQQESSMREMAASTSQNCLLDEHKQ